jgi:hypothetical protein
LIRTGYHIGGHYELYQAEGVNPTVLSYIVGEVTIELARMVDLAQAGQILVGDFQCPPLGDAVATGRTIATPAFISGCNRELSAMRGTQLSGKPIGGISCHLSRSDEQDGRSGPRRFRIVDKHGLSRHAYNLEVALELEGRQLSLGLDDSQLPTRGQVSPSPEGAPAQSGAAPSTDELIDDLAGMLKRRSAKSIVED